MYNNNVVKNDIASIIGRIDNLESLRGKTVMITGATGMIASYFMSVLMYLNDTYDYDIKIVPLVRNEQKMNSIFCCEGRKDIYPMIQDVCDDIKVDFDVDYIAHMASSANPANITTNPVGIIEANVLGTLNVLALAKEKNAKVLFTSTREIYGQMDESIDEIKETDMGALHPDVLRSCYPESKRLAETLFVSYAYQYGVKYVIARIAHSYGPGMIIKNDGRIMSDLIDNVVNEEDIVLKSKGEALRAFCYVSDCVSALYKIMLDGKENEFYNLSNETEEISIRDLAALLSRLSDGKSKVIFDIQENNNQYVTFKRVKLDNQKLYDIGWKPEVKLEDGLQRTLKYFKDVR